MLSLALLVRVVCIYDSGVHIFISNRPEAPFVNDLHSNLSYVASLCMLFDRRAAQVLKITRKVNG